MPFFQFKGRNPQGKLVSGRLEASDQSAALAQLGKRRIIPLDVKPVRLSMSLKELANLEIAQPRINIVDITFFSRQLYTLAKAGVPLIKALHGLRTSAINPAFAKVIASLESSLDSGESLSNAMRKHPKTFSELYVNLVGVGEATGRLPDVLLALSNYLQQDKDIQDRVKSALRYPTMVFVAIVIAMVVLNIFVIPTFANMFSTMGSSVPWATQILMSFSGFMVSYWPILSTVLVVIFFAIRNYIKTPPGKMMWHRLKITVPIFGPIIYGAAMSRFANGFSITSSAKVSVTQAIPLLAGAIDNVYLRDKMDAIKQGVLRGESFSAMAKQTKVFPPIVLQMLEVGEEIGRLDELLEEVADYFQRDVDYKLKGLSAAIEPVLIAVIGVIVMIVMLGIFIPMWSMMDTMRGR